MAWVSILSLTLSGAALVVSATTAWLTLFRKGAIKITRPRLVYFGWEETPSGTRPKIFLRCLLYSTGKRGQVIQNLFLRVRRGNYAGLFGAWAYGERNQLVPGSGLFVSQEGVAYNHHFLPQEDALSALTRFGYLDGDYTIDIMADVLNRKTPVKLSTIKVTLTEVANSRMYSEGVGVLFDWHPDSRDYIAEIGEAPKPQALRPPPPMRPGL